MKARLLVVLAAGLTLAACTTTSAGNGSGTASAPAAAVTTSSTASAPATTTAPPITIETVSTVPPPAPTPSPYPPGFPKVVAVSGLPAQVKNWMQIGGYTQAVQVAEGVWTPLPPGATPTDAAEAGALDGFCASVKAYETQYLNGQPRGGACW